MGRLLRRNTIVAIFAAGILLPAAITVYSSERVRCTLGFDCLNYGESELAQTLPPASSEVSTSTVSATTSSDELPIKGTGEPTPLPLPTPAPAPIIAPPYVAVPITTQPPSIPDPVIVAPEGPTTFSVSAVPLLTGGTVRAGESVPVSYLMVVNQGDFAARVTGFWIRQNGNAPTEVVVGLSTVDDKGGSRAQTGGTEGFEPFTNMAALAPTNAVLQPGQIRLFTIKAIMSADLSAFYGTALKIDVTGIRAEEVTVKGSFPIRGTTWTLAP